MARPASTFRTLYQQLCDLPPNMVGEILGGTLHAHPRPTARHAVAASVMGSSLLPAFQGGRGGPGGWWIIDEPELHLVRDTVVLVPDLAGWRKARMPELPEGHRFEIVPDWICEVLSPSTERYDREEKIEAYGEHGVEFAWLVAPEKRSLEILRRANSAWELVSSFEGTGPVSAPPFAAVTFELAGLWGE